MLIRLEKTNLKVSLKYKVGGYSEQLEWEITIHFH